MLPDTKGLHLRIAGGATRKFKIDNLVVQKSQKNRAKFKLFFPKEV